MVKRKTGNVRTVIVLVKKKEGNVEKESGRVSSMYASKKEVIVN